MTDFEKDPHDDDVEITFVAYECGWTELAPKDEAHKVTGPCVCGAELKE